MKLKKGITVILLAFAGISIVYTIAADINGKQPHRGSETEAVKAGEGAIPSEVTEKTDVIVYYFYGNKRCATCHKLEQYAVEALEASFPEALAEGEIVWQAINIDKKEHEHFIHDYQLISKAIVLCDPDNPPGFQRWRNLERIWELVGDKEQYMDYIETEVQSFREESS